MSDDEGSFASRRRRRRVVDSDEEEDMFSSRNTRQESVDEAPARRFGRKESSEEEEESTPAMSSGPTPGAAFSKLPEAKKKKIQQQLIEGMFKYAESKYGRKRPQRGEKQNAMEDYDLYLRSMKAKVKTVSDKLAAVQKQKKDIDAKVAQAEKDFQLQQGKLDKAEEEKKNAVDEGRDPILPKDFIVPQRAKKANAGLGALVMKASSKMWEDQFSAMRSKKKNESTPDWLAKQKKTDKTSAILSVGRKKTEKKGEAATPQFANALKKSDGGSRRRRKEEEAAPNPFKVNLKKTGLRNEEEDDKPSAKAPVKETPKPEPTPEPVAAPEPEPEPEEEEEEEEIESSFSSRRRQRRRYDSDEDAW